MYESARTIPGCMCARVVCIVYLPLVNYVGVPVLLYYNFGTLQPINRPPSSVVLAVSTAEMGPLYQIPTSAWDINVFPL